MSCSTRARSPHWVLPIMVSVAAFAGCGKKKEAPPPPPPPEVAYVTVKAQPLTLTTELPGRTAAFRVAEVRPQVNGIIQKRLFVEGSLVKAGQQLYQIDPAPYQASLNSALATQKKAESSVTSARLLAQRYQPLAEVRAVSRQDYDNAVSSQGQAEADVASGKASVETARINLRYTRVTSPISGRTGRSSVTEGALVTAAQTNALATVQQLDPIYVDVTQPSTLLLRLKRDLASGKLKKSGVDQALVGLELEDGTPYALKGKLRFSEVTVDQGTGSVTLRAEFANPNGTLLPGMFVHLQLEEGERDNALLVPQQGITRDARGEPTAMVVGPDNKAVVKILKVDRAIGDDWLVNEGLAVGDKVIVGGLQAVRPGAPLRPKETTKAELNKPAPPVAPGTPGPPGTDGAASAAASAPPAGGAASR